MAATPASVQVDLAALELDAKQAEYLRKQLNNQLKAIHELEAILAREDVPKNPHDLGAVAEVHLGDEGRAYRVIHGFTGG